MIGCMCVCVCVQTNHGLANQVIVHGIKTKAVGCERIGQAKTDVQWYGLMGPLRGSEAGLQPLYTSIRR